MPAFPPDGFRYASELVEFIKRRGHFHILVGCYPEGHPEATSLQTDIDHFVRKVEAGADAAVTQYFFNNAGYFHFVDEVRRRGLDTPIVVGLMPAWPYQQVALFSEKCGADVPLWIKKRMEGYQDDPKSQFEFAVEVAVTQSGRASQKRRARHPLLHAEPTRGHCSRLRTSARPASRKRAVGRNWFWGCGDSG